MSSRYLNAWHGKNFQTGEICWQGRWSTMHGAVSWAGSCVYAAKAVAACDGWYTDHQEYHHKKEDELRWGQGGGAHLSHPSPHPAWPGPWYCIDCNVSWKVVTFSDRSSFSICLFTFKIWCWFDFIFLLFWMEWNPPYTPTPPFTVSYHYQLNHQHNCKVSLLQSK